MPLLAVVQVVAPYGAFQDPAAERPGEDGRGLTGHQSDRRNKIVSKTAVRGGPARRAVGALEEAVSIGAGIHGRRIRRIDGKSQNERRARYVGRLIDREVSIGGTPVIAGVGALEDFPIRSCYRRKGSWKTWDRRPDFRMGRWRSGSVPGDAPVGAAEETESRRGEIVVGLVG